GAGFLDRAVEPLVPRGSGGVRNPGRLFGLSDPDAALRDRRLGAGSPKTSFRRRRRVDRGGGRNVVRRRKAVSSRRGRVLSPPSLRFSSRRITIVYPERSPSGRLLSSVRVQRARAR